MPLHLRTLTEGREPTAAQLAKGEIGLSLHPNTPGLFIQDNAGAIRRFGVWVGTAAPPTPTAGELWFDTGSKALKCFDGTAWSSGGGAAGSGGGFPAGTRMLFQQSAAPPGWTKITSHDNKALRVVSGNTGIGGTQGFTTAFANRVVSGRTDEHAIDWNQMPSHNHGIHDPGHGHLFHDPGHAHGVHDPGHSHGYTRTDPGITGKTPTSGVNEQAHVRSLNQPWVGTEHKGTGIGIHGAGTNCRVDGNGTGIETHNAGSGHGHSHSLGSASLNLDVAYVDVILAVKD